jgi:hypothetical protein
MRVVEVALDEQGVSLERELVSLLGLFADREQPHLGIRDLEHFLGEDGAHLRELEQVLGPGIRVRAGVDEHRRAVPGRNDDGDRRPVDVREPPHVEEARSEHGAGVPGRDDGLGGALAHRAAGGHERAVGLGAHGLGGLLVHLDHLRRLDVLEPARVEPGRAEDHRLDPVGGSLERACDDFLGRPVPARRVNCDSGHCSKASLAMPTSGRAGSACVSV